MENEQQSAMRKLMDNPWLLLALGIGVPTVFYTIWGTVELLMLQKATLP